MNFKCIINFIILGSATSQIPPPRYFPWKFFIAADVAGIFIFILHRFSVVPQMDSWRWICWVALGSRRWIYPGYWHLCTPPYKNGFSSRCLLLADLATYHHAITTFHFCRKCNRRCRFGKCQWQKIADLNFECLIFGFGAWYLSPIVSLCRNVSQPRYTLARISHNWRS